MIGSAHLDEKRLHIGDLVLRRDVLLHRMLSSSYSHQDERIREDDDAAGHDIAEEEEADDIDHGWCAGAWRVPVDAAGSAVGLGAILTPSRQRSHRKHRRVTPHTHHQQTSVA